MTLVWVWVEVSDDVLVAEVLAVVVRVRGVVLEPAPGSGQGSFRNVDFLQLLQSFKQGSSGRARRKARKTTER